MKNEKKTLDKQTLSQLVEKATAEKPAPAYLKELRVKQRTKATNNIEAF